MTNNQLNRQRLEKIKSWRETYGAGSNVMLPAEEAEELARIALAAMDSEPVAWTWHYREQWHVTNDKCRAEFVAKDGDVAVLPLYRHAQPAPEYPEVLPCSVFLEPGLRFGKGVKTRLVLEAIQRRAEHYAELEAMTPEERAEYDAGIEAFKAMLPQPVPDNSAITQHFDTIALETAREIMCDVNHRHEFLGGEIQLLSRIQCRIDDACRAAMLNGGKP